MAERVIKTTIELDGEKQFKAALGSVNSELKVFDSELKLVEAQFGKTGQGMKGLQATADVLGKKVEAQKEKVKALEGAVGDSGKAYDNAKAKYGAAEKALEEATKAFGANSEEARRAQAELDSSAKAVSKAEKAYDSYTVQLNNAQASLIKTEREFENTSKAAKDLKNLKLKDLMPEKVAKEVEKVAKKFKEVATQAGKAAGAAAKIGGQAITKSLQAGTKALTAYTSAATAAGTAIVKMTGDAAEWADDLNTLSKQTGLTTEELQKMEYAAKLIDVDTDTITKSMAKLTKNLVYTSKDAGAAFQALGFSVEDENKNIKNNQDAFAELIEKLGTVENETERDAYAMAIFGKSAQELNPLIKGGAAELKRLGDEAEAAGLILSQEGLDSLNKYNDSVDKLKTNLSTAGNVISTAFAPKLQTLTDRIGQSIPNIATLFGNMFTGDKAAGLDFRETVGTLVDELLADVNEMLPDLLDGLNVVLLTIADNVPKAVTTLLPTFIDGLTDLALGLVDEVPTLLPMIVQGGADLFTGLIGGLNKTLDKLIPMLPGIVRNIGDTLINNAPLILETGITLLANLVEGIATSVPALIEKATELIPVMIKALTDNLPLLIQAGIDLIVAFAESLPVAIPAILEAIPQIIDAIITGLSSVDWADTSEKIFDGLGKGLISVFSGALGIIDSLLGTNLQQWYDETTTFFKGLGAEMYTALHAEELEAEASKNKAEELKYDLFRLENDLIRSGSSASEALAKAKEQLLDTQEKAALYDKYLKDVVNEAEASERYNTIRAAGANITSGASMTTSQAIGLPSNVPAGNVTNYTFNNSYYKKATPAEQRKDQQQQQQIAALYSA